MIVLEGKDGLKISSFTSTDKFEVGYGAEQWPQTGLLTLQCTASGILDTLNKRINDRRKGKQRENKGKILKIKALKG